MERIKIPKNIFIPLIISLVLFLIPFFWFKPGEMDLGGDSSRLYFYDPLSYLSKAALYVISPSSYGAEYLGYANIPFIFFLFILKSIVMSPTILICMFYGISLSGAFLFTYLSIKELLNTKNSWWAAAVGGLVYTFSPSTVDGWKHVLITYNHVFLSPLVFYLLLRYFKTSNIRYLLGIVLVTFIFSPNFSVSAAPSIFSFYPISLLFLLLYTTLILKRKIIVKHILLASLLFIGVQVFHLLPLLSSIFSAGNDINATIFTEKGKFDRGLSYFSAIAPSIKASLNLFMLPQMRSLSFFSNIFIIFPFVIVIGLVFNKKKTMLLTAVFFVIILFFTTGNITNIWLSVYKSLFSVPGFSMFRNFHSQWVYTYMFFYALLFGQALYIIIDTVPKIYKYILPPLLIVILTINAWTLIKGDIPNEILWQSKNVKASLQIDPDYEKALSYVRSLPADARVLTLPMTDPGYQIIAGKNGGAYMGPSTISYLGGKKDFAGYDELLDYKDIIGRLIRDKEYEKLKNFLGFLNIKYIFYDADPLVYDKFPSFPYEQAHIFLPKDQKSYKEFIQKLQIKEIKNINDKFFVYELPERHYIPQANIVGKLTHFNQKVEDIETILTLEENTENNAIFFAKNVTKEPPVVFNETVVDLTEKSEISNLMNVTKGPSYDFPFASWEVSSIMYPYILSREKKELNDLNDLNVINVDRRIFLAEKRISELIKWGDKAWVLGNVKSIDRLSKSWQEPTVLEAVLFGRYNYWEIGLMRYQHTLYSLIDQIDARSKSDPRLGVYKERIRKALSSDKNRVYQIIVHNKKLNTKQKKYLFRLALNMFASITHRLGFPLPSLNTIRYDLSELKKGTYSVYVDTNTLSEYAHSEIQLNGKQLFLTEMEKEKNWVKATNISLEENPQNNLILTVPKSFDLIANNAWAQGEKGKFGSNSASMLVNNSSVYKNGIVMDLTNWKKNSFYIISFDYHTYGKSFNISLGDKSVSTKKPLEGIVSDELYSSEWKQYKGVIASSKDASLGILQITKTKENEILEQIETGNGLIKIDIRNLSLIEIPNPKIILKRVSDEQDEKYPTISFKRINPSRYEVAIQHATSPYTLMLVNQFNPRWKLIDPTRNMQTTSAWISRIVANIGKNISVFGGEGIRNNDVELQHRNEKVIEQTSQDIFFNSTLLDTWGKIKIAEDKHFSVNGYANAWYIEPQDMQGKQEYTLVIEMTSQKMLYGGLFLSVVTFFVCVLLLARTFFKK